MLLPLVSCSKEPVEMNGEPSPVELLTLSEESLDAVADGATFTVTATSRYMPECRVEYSDSQYDEWITCSVGHKSSYDVPLNIEIAENKTFQDRSATISVVIRDDVFGVEYAKSISVTQTAAVPKAENNEYKIPADTYNINFTIKTNLINYTINSKDSWVKLNKSSGSGNTIITVSVEANPYQTERSTSLYIKSADAEFEVIKITQEAMVYKWSTFVDGKEYSSNNIGINVPWYAEEFTVDIATNLSWKSEISSGSIYVDSYTKNCDVPTKLNPTKTEFKFKLKENREANRTVVFKVYSIKDRHFATNITVTQSFAPTISVNNDEDGVPLRFEAADYSVGVNTNQGVKWNAQSDADWLKIKTSNGEGSASLEYSVSQNDGASPRTATISVSLSDYEGIVAEYRVTQNCDKTIHYTAKSKLSINESVDYWGDKIVGHEYDEPTQKGYIEFETAPTKVGNRAFFECVDLISVKLPKSVTSIGSEAFSSCANLESVTIPNGVISIGNHAFWSCGSLQSVDLPDGLTSINSAVFAQCTSLKTINIPDSVTLIDYSAFMGCTGLTSVTLGNGLQSIGAQAFNTCSALTTITIPESVTSIGARAFGYYTGELIINSKVVEVDNTEKPEWLSLSEISKVTIGDNITHIGAYTFDYRTTLKNVTLSSSVTSIGEYAFANCKSLESINIPSSVTTIGNCAFIESTGELLIDSKIIERDNNASQPGWAFGNKMTKVTIGNNITRIGDYAFLYFEMTSVTIPDSVISIGHSAFRECKGLTSVTIPNSVTTIGEYAFQYCESMTSVTMGSGVTSIDKYAFSNCTGLTRVNISDLSAWCKIDFGHSSSNPLSYAKYLYLDGVLVEDIIIPADMTEVKPYVFANCEKLKSVTMPDGVTSIGRYAFHSCSGLTNITIPDKVTSIGELAFYMCTGLTSITIPDKVTSIGEYAFYYCKSLKEVYCKPTTPPTGGSYMFHNNAAGRKISVPTDSVDAYKKAIVWSGYSSYIVGYNF